MNFEIVFYHSGKTGELERLLADELAKVQLHFSRSCAASDPEELAEQISTSLRRSNLILCVGGTDGGKQSSETILSEVLNPSDGHKIQKKHIRGDDESVCLSFCSGKQTILLLSDNSDEIRKVMISVRHILAQTYQLKEAADKTIATEDIAKELDKQLAGMNRTKVIPQGSTAEKRRRRILSNLKTAVIVLLLLAAAQLAAAGYLFLTNR